MVSFDFEPMADNPYDRLGVSPEMSDREIKRASMKARAKYQPDKYPEDEKEWARKRLYRIQDAVDAIESETAEHPSGDRESGTGSGSTDPDVVRLSAAVEPTSTTVFDPVTVRATDGAGEPVPDVDVSAPRIDPKTTDSRGEASVEFDAAGTYAVTVDRSDGDRTYVSDSAAVEVDRIDVDLSLDLDAETLSTDDSTMATVTDEEGDRIEDVTVETSRGGRYEAPTGRTRVSFDEPGTVDLTARKSRTDAYRYREATTTVEVEPPSREPVGLSIDAATRSPTVGDSVGFAVTADGDPVPGATVSGAGDEATTDTRGECHLTPAETGEETVTARKTDGDRSYHAASVSIEVAPAPTELSLVLDRTVVDPGEVVSVVAVDGDENPVPNVTLETDTGDEYFLDDGTGRVTLSTPGEVKLAATVRDGHGESTGTAATTVRVREHADGDDGTAGGERDAAAEAGDDGGRSGSGEATSAAESDGSTEAATDGFRGETSGGAFAPDPGAEAAVRIERSTDRIAVDETIEFTVVDADGERVDGASVEILETGEIGTAEGGTWSYGHDEGGLYTAVATVEDDGRTLESEETKFKIRDPTGGGAEEPDRTGGTEGGTLGDVGPEAAKPLLLVGVVALMASFAAPAAFGTIGYLAVAGAGGALVLAAVAFFAAA
ncbi:J domain-containing protein [Halorubrum sodomense]|uniref:J domain-containing protein n=1 Tax=Halorubrum sodomense TaxID=35743 RepID=A0A1I6FZQ4_HALSD|nr:hypothetical protein [Halorubrum sodomense]SFR35418.1 hypothetical protein SAMN04487937_1433 [Halorubrum sodomense]